MSNHLDLHDPDWASAELELERSILRESLADFVRASWHVLEATTPLVWGRHLDVICGAVQAVIEDWAHRQRDPSFVQPVRDLLVTLPPGTLKSRVLALSIPWAWLRYPELRAICLSTNPRVALRDSVYAREVVGSSWYQRTFEPTWTVKTDVDAKGMFANSAGGYRSAMGIDARIVGERGDLIVVDDPHDPEEAESEAQRSAVLERWDTSISNRLNDLGSSIRIGICQRVHEHDWAAARIAEGWCHVNLPLEFEPESACHTVIASDWRTIDGECLHPARFTLEVIAAEKLRCGERRWATLYQQRPAPAAGSIVRTSWLRFWRAPDAPDASITRPKGCWSGPAIVLPPKMDATVIAADLAMGKATASGDYNVIVAVGRKGSSFYLLECWRARADFPEVQRQFRAMASRHPRGAKKVVEQAAAGASLVASLKSEISGLVGIPPSGSKEQRLQAVLAFFEAGNVHLDETWTGLDAAVSELVTFPNARHDDFVDAMTLALGQLSTNDADVERARKMNGLGKMVTAMTSPWSGPPMPVAAPTKKLADHEQPAEIRKAIERAKTANFMEAWMRSRR